MAKSILAVECDVGGTTTRRDHEREEILRRMWKLTLKTCNAQMGRRWTGTMDDGTDNGGQDTIVCFLLRI
jgi:hypothetical protein